MTSNYRKNTSNTYTAKDFLTRTSADSLYLNVADNEVVGGQILSNNIVGVTDCFTAGANSLVLNTIPITDVDRTSSIINDKNLTNKKYVDTAINTCAKISASNTYTANNTFNANLTVASSLSADSNAISLTLLPRLSSQIVPSDNKDLASKKYVDDSTSAILVSAQSSMAVCGLQTYSYFNSSGNNYYFYPPQTTQQSWCVYLNFPTASSGRYYSPSCQFNFKYYYTQCAPISGVISVTGSGSSSTYYTSTLQPNSIVVPCNTNGILNQFSSDASFLVSIVNGGVYTSAPIQTTNVWVNPSVGTPTGSSVSISAKYGTGASPATYTCNPISFTYINDYKLRINVNFPVINALSSVSNDPRVQGWISSAGFSVNLLSSAAANSTLQSNLITTPNVSKANSNAGSAWITLS